MIRKEFSMIADNVNNFESHDHDFKYIPGSKFKNEIILDFIFRGDHLIDKTMSELANEGYIPQKILFLSTDFFLNSDKLIPFQNIEFKWFNPNPKVIYFISHKWISKGVVDIDNILFSKILKFLMSIHNKDVGIFLDYCCLPQFELLMDITPKSKLKLKEYFMKSLFKMNLVLRHSTLVTFWDNDSIDRGWLVFEYLTKVLVHDQIKKMMFCLLFIVMMIQMIIVMNWVTTLIQLLIILNLWSLSINLMDFEYINRSLIHWHCNLKFTNGSDFNKINEIMENHILLNSENLFMIILAIPFSWMFGGPACCYERFICSKDTVILMKSDLF